MLYKPEFFDLEEIVCKHVFDKFGVIAWQFFDDRALRTIDFIRQRLNKRITVNNWHEGGSFSQRGFRCTQCQLIVDAVNDQRVYCTPHARGVAFDFDVEGLVAEEVRQWLIKNYGILPYAIRLENHVSWVHMDTVDNNGQIKVLLFNP